MESNGTKIYFCITLGPDKPDAYWNLNVVEECRQLVITQMVLGAGANAGEENVVMLKTADYDVVPIVSLYADENRVADLNLEFYESEVEFTLAVGSGPVNIFGYLVLSYC